MAKPDFTFERNRFTKAAGRGRGSMLIIAMGVLTLLAVLGATFVSLMKLEKQATKNYIDGQVVDLVNESALERVIAEIRGIANHYSYTTYRAPWLYKLRDPNEQSELADLAAGRADIESPRVGHWDILSQEEQRLHRYKTKVIDCSSQINLNGRQDSLPRMLENLAQAIISSTWLGKGSQNPLYTGPHQTGQRVTGIQIVEFRNKLEGHRFRSKTQLRDLIGKENFDTIKDFITVHAWEDPYTYKPDDGLDEISLLKMARSGGGGVGGGARSDHHDQVEGAGNVSSEPRSPININTAPEEVLIACLMGISGRRAFPYARLNYERIDEHATISGLRIPGQEEVADLLPRGVWVYMRPLTYDNAKKIALRIISDRKTASRQFMTWSSGEAGRPGFAEFINQLPADYFPAPGTARIVDPRNVRDTRVGADIMGAANELSVGWRRGHDLRERQFRLDAGQPFHTQFAFYYDMVKAAIIANFNPNTRLNRSNPNVTAYTPVDKSNLVMLDPRDGTRTLTRKGYTTEFCFDSTGIFEVTTLGEIAMRDQESSGLTSVRSGGEEAGVEFTPLHQKKMQSIVKIFDVLRHTNQFHFERTFQSGQLSSRANRRYVLTWPDAMQVLTDALSSGSRRDGRVELAGFKDGQRNLLPTASRYQTLKAPEEIAMAHTFDLRDDVSYAQLKRLVRTGGTGKAEFLFQMKEALNAGFSRINSRLRQYYGTQFLQSLGIGQGGTAAINTDPIVDKDENNPNLRPDGFQTSLFNTGHGGARFLLLPAHNRINEGTGKSGMAAQVGAGYRNNLTGNVPYYEGGIAFWVKFEFDGDDRVFSGLIGCTQVIEDVGQQLKDSEGSQFYIFKNTKGQLRVVRMYYHQAFPAGLGEGDAGGLNLWPPVETGDQGGKGDASTGQENPMLKYLDQKKPFARTDVFIDVSHFRAHEWHHIAVDWNDQIESQALKVYIDFEEAEGGRPFHPQAVITNEPTSWVRLNVRRPRDELFVGGFIRQQQVKDAGVFKWFTTVSSPVTGSAGVGGIQVVEPSVKRILANATIDELVTYTGTFNNVKSFFVTGANPGYFTNQTGEYANLMEVPMPPEVDHVVLRSFDWTAYYPSFYTGYTPRQPQKLQPKPLRCQLYLGRETLPPFEEPWRTPQVVNRVAGRPLFRSQAGGLLGRNAELLYRFTLQPGIANQGSVSGGAVQTPVLDDVTVTYYLPDAKILHQEEVD
ncbi:MAG: hypothetical protein HY717_20950 [Planctomycetes bacterium]|nr:hypothetical protein [Planctomycetota bacterium]